MKEILDVIHKTIYQFFDVCGDDEEVPLSDKDKLLLKVNKAICNNLKALEIEPCEDAISRQAVIDEIEYFQINPQHFDFVGLIDNIKDLPSVNPQPKIGHWISVNTGKPSCIKDGMVTESVRCSECDEWLTASDEYDCYGNYCPNCGAKMERSDKE